MKRNTIVIDGVRIHWEATGVATGRPPVVLLHGLNESHRSWRHVAAELATDRLVLLPDLPGHGFSDRPNASYDFHWYAKLMAKWLQAVTTEPVDLVGHSFGGGVAQAMMLYCRDRIRRLALVAAGGLGREVAFPLRLAALPYVVEYFGQPFMALGVRLLHRNGRRPEADIEALAAMNRQPGTARAFARTVRHIIDWRGQRETYHGRIHEVGPLPPIRLFWGARDGIIPITHGNLMAASFEEVGLTVFPEEGHDLLSEPSGAFARSLRTFLDERSLPPSRLRPPVTPEEKGKTPRPFPPRRPPRCLHRAFPRFLYRWPVRRSPGCG